MAKGWGGSSNYSHQQKHVWKKVGFESFWKDAESVVNICARLFSFIEGVVVLLIRIRVSSFHEGFGPNTTKHYTESQSPGPPFCVDNIGGFPPPPPHFRQTNQFLF